MVSYVLRKEKGFMLNMCHKSLFSIYDRASKSEIHFLVESTRSYQNKCHFRTRNKRITQ